MRLVSQIYLLLLTLYIFIYKIFLSSHSDLIKYIINPLIWIMFSLYGYIFIYRNKRRYYQYESEIIYTVITNSLLYVLLFYSLGFIVGYANNPYSKEISGIIINLFSLLLVIGLKEYIRGILINEISKNKIIHLIIITLIFIITDLNILMIIKEISNINNLLNILIKFIIPTISINIFLTYLCSKGGYVPSIIYRLITVIPFYIIPITPKYDIIIPTLFDTLIPLFTYLFINYQISKRNKNTKLEAIKPSKWIITFITTLILLMFSLGVFSIKPVVILTGSMLPSIKIGDIVIIKQCEISNIQIRDIVQYKINNYEVIHRVVKIITIKNEVMLITKGDNNLKEDKIPVTKDNLVGCFKHRVPYLGYPAYFVRKLFIKDNVNIETGD